jgi:hypothetical protein
MVSQCDLICAHSDSNSDAISDSNPVMPQNNLSG